MKYIIPATLVGISIAAVLYLLAKSPLPLTILGALIGAGGTLFFLSRSRGENPVEMAQEVVNEVIKPDPGANERYAQEQLFQACEAFVISGASQNMELHSSLKEIVSSLRVVLPRAIEFAPTSEKTFSLKKLAGSDLPDFLEKFAGLSSADQTNKSADFSNQLNELNVKLNELISFIDENNSDQFETQSTFLDMKF